MTTHGHAPIVWTIVVAAGSGQRFGGPKQYESLGGARIIDHSVARAAECSHGVVVVVPAQDVAVEQAGLSQLVERTGPTAPRQAGPSGVDQHPLHRAVIVVVAGGASRRQSVARGLAAVADDAEVICVHDGARPLASANLFAAVVAAVAPAIAPADDPQECPAGAIPGLPVTDTIKRVDAGGTVISTPPRAELVAVQTPQAFRADALRAAHATTPDDAPEATDDAAMVEQLGGRVIVIAGEPWNRKITSPEDLQWARARLTEREHGTLNEPTSETIP